ncbi:hypothetical protein DICPUDRAFT_93138 [Dictyostelium purpureum]|uniref:Pleckstrin domain-containing protein n=1 Tax=Dictyostelium purpureum TaxID=5786 RepID=F1A2T0_DICPU|nr:uncharacterized protein DICPUDRAFT_93138 [Dictyostelium purpureum]EGC29497.1 hypothetical protein DICPUDRAFT_93138 [Dictyostelium purpureum]|eukprot:XP_003293972.1 hypothetical protein DICPUDRAFT_93138 [Dictyostelium purpureum]
MSSPSPSPLTTEEDPHHFSNNLNNNTSINNINNTNINNENIIEENNINININSSNSSLNKNINKEEIENNNSNISNNKISFDNIINEKQESNNNINSNLTDNDSDDSNMSSSSSPQTSIPMQHQNKTRKQSNNNFQYITDNNSIASSSSNINSPAGLVQTPYTPDGITIKRPIMSSSNLERKKSFFTEDGDDKNIHEKDTNLKSTTFSPKLSSRAITPPKKPSMFPCLVIVLFEILIGLGTVYPLVIGIIRSHTTLLIYGCFGAIFFVFAVSGFLSLLNLRPTLLKIYYYWKFASLGFIILVTIAVGLLSYYDEPLVSSWWASLILAIGIAILFYMWTITCILWVKPFIKEIRSVESVVLKEIVDEENTKDVSSELEIDQLDQLTTKPQYGIVQPEEPLRIAMRKFNKNPDTGIQFITEKNILDQTPYKDIVTFLYHVDGLNKVKVGDYLGENNPFNINILQQFVELYNFYNKDFDESLREFLSKFRLPGEAQKIDRIMESFAKKYHKDNPGTFPDSDTAYLLAFSLILLNTDAHNPAIKNKMTKKSFVQNNTGFKGKKDLPIEYLENLYDRIINSELKMSDDSLFSNAQIKGWLFKMTSNEKKWQKRWFVLKNNCLYYFKNEKDEDHPKVIIPLEGLKVTLVSDLVFEIEDSTVGTIKSVKLKQTGPIEGQHSKYLLKAPTIEESNKWVDSIRNNVLGSPVLQLIKKKKKILNRPSGKDRRKSVANEAESAKSYNNRGSGASTSLQTQNNTVSSSSSSPSTQQQHQQQNNTSDNPSSRKENDFETSGSIKSDDYLSQTITETSQSKKTENDFLFN